MLTHVFIINGCCSTTVRTTTSNNPQDITSRRLLVSGSAWGISELSGCLGPPGHQRAPNQEKKKLIFIFFLHIKGLQIKFCLGPPKGLGRHCLVSLRDGSIWWFSKAVVNGVVESSCIQTEEEECWLQRQAVSSASDFEIDREIVSSSCTAGKSYSSVNLI